MNPVLPGPTLSDGLRDMLAERDEQSGKDIDTVAVEFVMEARPSSNIHRATTPEEVANMILCRLTASLGHDWASLRVDGGVIETL